MSLLPLLKDLPRRQPLLFVLAFALVGSIIVWRSFAATTLVTFESETMSLPTTGASIITDSTASAGKALLMTARGTASGTVNLPSTANQITVRAKAESCGGSPQLVVKIDGVQVQSSNITATSWAESAPVTVNLATGAHTLTVDMASDAYTQTAGNSGKIKCQRKLYVDKVTFLGSTPATTTVTVSNPINGSTVSGGVAVEAKASGTNGISKVEFYLDNVLTKTEQASPYCMAGDSGASPCYAWNSATVANGAHTITAYAYDSAGTKSAGSTVMFTVNNTTTTPPPTGCVTVSPSTTKLKASGRDLVDENGAKACRMKGFNMHVGPGFTWPQSNFDEIKNLIKTADPNSNLINRAVIHWDQIEPSQGVINGPSNPMDANAATNSFIYALDNHVARAQAAGMYTMFELHLNLYGDDRIPDWTNNVQYQMDKYTTYGRTLTQYLAQRYGNPSSPKYSKAVLGFGLNEPPLEDSNVRNSDPIPYLEGKQRTMISWMRASGYAPDWIGFVAEGYAQATTLYNTWGTASNTTAHDASPTAYDSVGGNVVYDLHDYMGGCSNTDPACDGRQYNGTIANYTGGSFVGVGNNFSLTSTSTGQLAAFAKPYKEFLNQASIPLMVGEWGWPNSGSGEVDWLRESKKVWQDAGSAIEIYWNYDTCSCKTEWSSKINDTTWRPSVLEWIKP